MKDERNGTKEMTAVSKKYFQSIVYDSMLIVQGWSAIVYEWKKRPNNRTIGRGIATIRESDWESFDAKHTWLTPQIEYPMNNKFQ